MYSKKKTYKGKGTRRLNKTRRKSKTRRSRTRTRQIRGGSAMSPLFGSPYNATDADPQGNYYAYNQKVEAWPAPSNPQFSMGGGRRRKGKKGKRSRGRHGKTQRGGSISNAMSAVFPLEMINIGRSIPAGLGHMYDRFNGSLSMPSSLVHPTQQPLASTSSSADILGGTNRMMTPPDLTKMYINNNNAVSKI
jgi:hypothetical protein